MRKFASGKRLAHSFASSLPERFAVFHNPAPAVVVTFLVYLLAGWVMSWSWTHQSTIDRHSLVIFACLASLALLHYLFAGRVEKTRQMLTDAPNVNLNSVWGFAGAMLLPPSLSTLLVAGSYAVMSALISGTRGRARYRHIYSASCMILATFAVWLLRSSIMTDLPPNRGDSYLITLVASVIVFTIVETGLTALAYSLRGQGTSLVNLIGSWGDNALELATLCLASLIALIANERPLAIFLLTIPLLVLHRAVLTRQLEELAYTDQKTGLLNAASWRSSADRELRRTERRRELDQEAALGVLMLDLDHFKKVNDTYGHLAGDEVLKHVARAITTHTRRTDAVGRFGGEEFVVLIAEVPQAEVVDAAERIRRQVAELDVYVDTEEGQRIRVPGLSASIGVATYPTGGRSIDELLKTADTAVYAAKRGGRNRVVSLTEATVPQQKHSRVERSSMTPGQQA